MEDFDEDGMIIYAMLQYVEKESGSGGTSGLSVTIRKEENDTNRTGMSG